MASSAFFHPLLSGMPNFHISEYKDIEFAGHKFIGQDKKPVSIEGHKYCIEYRLNKGSAGPGELKIRKVVFDDNFNRENIRKTSP